MTKIIERGEANDDFIKGLNEDSWYGIRGKCLSCETIFEVDNISDMMIMGPSTRGEIDMVTACPVCGLKGTFNWKRILADKNLGKCPTTIVYHCR